MSITQNYLTHIKQLQQQLNAVKLRLLVITNTLQEYQESKQSLINL